MKKKIIYFAFALNDLLRPIYFLWDTDKSSLPCALFSKKTRHQQRISETCQTEYFFVIFSPLSMTGSHRNVGVGSVDSCLAYWNDREMQLVRLHEEMWVNFLGSTICQQCHEWLMGIDRPLGNRIVLLTIVNEYAHVDINSILFKCGRISMSD